MGSEATTPPAASTTPPNPDAMRQFALKVIGDLAAAMAGPLLYIGDREGLFKVLARQPCTPAELAARTGLQERYLREWASALTAAEYLDYDPATGAFSLRPERAMVVAQEDSPVFCGGMVQMIPDHYRMLPRILEAFHHGGGVPYADYGEDTHRGTERLFRPAYVNLLVQRWIPALPQVEARLRQGARVADVGCGRGQALRVLAQAFPASQFRGFDNYAPSLAYATAAAEREGLADRLQFELRAADDLPQTHEFDLVMTCNSFHDLKSPEACARSIAGALAPNGTWFCIEPKLGDRLENNTGPVSRLFYAVSTMQCMPCSLNGGGAGYGTGMGPARIRQVASDAGLGSFTPLEIEHLTNQFFAIRAA